MPLLWPTVGLIAGIWGSEAWGPLCDAARWGVWIAPFGGVVLLLLRHGRGRGGRRAMLAIAAVTALFVGFARHQVILHPPSDHVSRVLASEPVLTRVAGRIVTPPVERAAVKRNPFVSFDPAPRTRFVLALEELRTVDPPAPMAGMVRVNVEAGGLPLRLGEAVELTGRLYRPRGPRNPGERDWARWYRYEGIDAGLAVEGRAHVRKLPAEVGGWPRLVNAARDAARGLLFEPYADVEAESAVRLLDVLVLGQRREADQRLNEAFLRAGGMHFLSVSGFHVAALAGAVWWLARRVLRFGRRGGAAAMVAVTLLYALVAEPNAPILRAALMVVCFALALLTNRPLCAVNALALAAAAILLVNPLELFRAGFQLSFVQVLGLITVVPRIYGAVFRRDPEQPPEEARGLWHFVGLRVRQGIVGAGLICVVAWVLGLPLTLLHFGRWSAWGWLGTFILSPLVAATIVLSLLTIVAGVLPLPVAGVLGLLLRGATGTLLWAVELFDGWPGAVVECQPPWPGLVAATYALPVLWLARRPRTGRAVADPARPRRGGGVPAAVVLWAVPITLAALGWLAWLAWPGFGRQSGYAVHVLAVGNGCCVLVAGPGGDAVVCDVGTDANADVGETAARALRALGARSVERVLVSHTNFDHYSGLPTLLGTMRVRGWASNPHFTARLADEGPVRRLLDALPDDTPPPAMLRAGDSFRLGEAAFEVLWPPADAGPHWRVNDTSLVVRARTAEFSVLLTGDIERAALRGLLAAERRGEVDLRADVLVAPHHGAVVGDETADFLAAVSPGTIVVSSRTPRPKLERLAAEVLGTGCQVLLTGEVGAVAVHGDVGGRPVVETPYAGARP